MIKRFGLKEAREASKIFRTPAERRGSVKNTIADWYTCCA